MRREIEKLLWDRPGLMVYVALLGALALILGVMWLTGELPENPPNKLNILREGVRIPQQ